MPTSRRQAVALYERACRVSECEPYPDEDTTLRTQLVGFFTQYVRTGKSHRSVMGYVLCLLKHVRLLGRPLGATAHARLMASLTKLRKKYPATIVRSAPITSATYGKVYAYLNPFAAAGGLYATSLLALLAVSMHGLLRCNEALRLQWDDIGLDPLGRIITIWSPLRKNQKEVISALDLIALPFSSGPDDPARAVARLAHLRARSMPTPGAQPLSTHRTLVRDSKGIMHPPQDRGGLLFVPMAFNGALVRGSGNTWLNDSLRRVFALSGLPPPPPLWRVGSQGLRRGGATGLRLSGLPPDEVRRMGQWRSEQGYLAGGYDARGVELAEQAAALQPAQAPRSGR